MCWKVLGCVAVCCSVMQYVAVCCCLLQRIAVYWSVLQCVGVCCSVLQRVEACCSMVRCVAVCCSVLQCVVMCCNVLQCVAVCWSVLECVVVCCRVLLCVAAHHTSWSLNTISGGIGSCAQPAIAAFSESYKKTLTSTRTYARAAHVQTQMNFLQESTEVYTLQHTATHCNLLQLAATRCTHCNTL